MAIAQALSPAIAIPRRGSGASARLTSRRLLAWLPLMSVLAGIISLFYLAQTSDLTSTRYSIQQLQAEENNWQRKNEQLSLELARAKSLSAVEAQATGRMLMVPPRDVVYLRASPSDSAGRASASSRGDGRQAPLLEKVGVQHDSDPLEPVRDSLLTLLAPRSQR